MFGIWSISVRLKGTAFTDGYVLAQIVIQCIFFVAILSIWHRLPSRGKSIGNAFSLIRYSIYPLLLWYLIMIADLFLHESQLATVYGYILFYLFITIAKLAADILILSGTNRVMTWLIHGRLKIPAVWVLTGELLVIAVITTALYYLGSFCANEVLWLNVADPATLSEISTRNQVFGTAFFTLQFILTLFTFIAALIPIFQHSSTRSNQTLLAAGASAVLLIRSFSELIVVVGYHLPQFSTGRSADVAKYLIYGLCTFTFLILISGVAKKKSSVDTSDDRVQAAVERDCYTYVLKAVGDAAKAKQPPPVLSDLFQKMRQDSTVVLSEATRELDTRPPESVFTPGARHPENVLVACVDKMEHELGNLHPVDPRREH